MRCHLSWSHQKINYLLSSQLKFLEFYHVLTVFVYGQDGCSVKMTTCRVHGNHLFANSQVSISSFLCIIEITCRGIALVWALLSANLSSSPEINSELKILGIGNACLIILWTLYVLWSGPESISLSNFRKGSSLK